MCNCDGDPFTSSGALMVHGYDYASCVKALLLKPLNLDDSSRKLVISTSQRKTGTVIFACSGLQARGKNYKVLTNLYLISTATDMKMLLRMLWKVYILFTTLNML